MVSVSEIVDLEVPLGASKSRLIIGNGCREQLLVSIRESSGRVVVVSDQNVKEAWGDSLLTEAPWLVVPPGEASKDLTQAAKLWSEMVRLQLDRSSAVVAVGGGVVSDLAGFVASTFLRGVSFFSLPTSLLAMVDASVGGKVGIDLPEGKNLVGQFYPAQTVAVDPELLETLPDSQWSAGMAEVIKHGILQGPELWQRIRDFHPGRRSDSLSLNELLRRAVQVKVDVVAQDPYERTGLRATLNLGHTFGHAIEWCSGFQLEHGQAVALGLVAGLRLSKTLSLLRQDFEAELLELLAAWNLPLGLPSEERYRWEHVAAALGRDKKNKDGQWCFILPLAVGEVRAVTDAPRDLVRQAYESLKGSTA